jgi:hypothetical protein
VARERPFGLPLELPDKIRSTRKGEARPRSRS